MAFRVQVADTDQSFEVGADESVLAAAMRSNVDLAHDCQLGGCGSCRIKLLQGSVTYPEFPMALTPEEAEQGYALACQAQPTGDLVIQPARAGIELPPVRRCAAVVDSVSAASLLVTHLTVRIAEEEVPAYLPGQYMNIVLPDSDVRSFSMASAPKGGLVDFHIRRLAGGRFTDEGLSRLRPGDRLDVELPLGSFCFRAEDYRPLLMVATGTGLAPLKAMLEQLMDCNDCPPVSLYWGTRTAEDLYLHDAITRWSERLYEFNYVPVLSRPDAAWQGRRGYVQDAVCADLDDLSEHAIYLCGSPQMISSAKLAFLARGASAAHLYSEGFIPQTAAAAAA